MAGDLPGTQDYVNLGFESVQLFLLYAQPSVLLENLTDNNRKALAGKVQARLKPNKL